MTSAATGHSHSHRLPQGLPSRSAVLKDYNYRFKLIYFFVVSHICVGVIEHPALPAAAVRKLKAADLWYAHVGRWQAGEHDERKISRCVCDRVSAQLTHLLNQQCPALGQPAAGQLWLCRNQ